MSQFSSFDGLPIIVHDGILRALSSPMDVANTISASPGSLQAYMTGSRSVVLLATMRNFLSLENQHLMNLVIAAPHYYNNGECDNRNATAVHTELDDVNSRDKFDRAVRRFLRSFNSDGSCFKYEMRHLTPKTFESSFRLYAIMDKAVRTYSPYTLALAQLRVNKLSGPQTSRSLRQSSDSDQPAPDDRETQRLWREFLLNELFCITWGMPQISAHPSKEWPLGIHREVEPTFGSFLRMPMRLREEFICVRQYAMEQYDLALNTIVGSFELAVAKMGRRAPLQSSSTADALDMTPVFELTRGDFPQPVQYLFQPPTLTASPQNNWRDSAAMLGVRFLHQFLSRDPTTRLDFFRATYPFLHRGLLQPIYSSFMCGIMDRRLMKPLFVWDSAEPGEKRSALRCLRAVGWIFWESPDRLASMDLVPERKYSTYGYKGAGRILPHLGLQDRSFPVEKAIEPKDWEPLIQNFGYTNTQNQFDEVRQLFRSAGNLKIGEVTRIVAASRHQDVGVARSEDKDCGD